MRKKIIGIFICTLLISSTTTLALTPLSRNEQPKNQFSDTTQVPSTHTIFCELQTATWCQSCPKASGALNNIYKSNDYAFYYVVLVTDMNPNAQNRARDYVKNLLPTYISLPTVYFDGGDKNFIGAYGSVNTTETAYREILEDVKDRSVTQPIELSSEIVWAGDGKITVTLTIKNNGDKPYFGKVRSYITEIVSRWKDVDHKPYDFGFLDFAIDTVIFVSAGKTKTISEQWDATQAHGQNFGTISKDNIMVISTISYWIPHYRTGYEHVINTQWYFAYYVDQTTAATPVLL